MVKTIPIRIIQIRSPAHKDYSCEWLCQCASWLWYLSFGVSAFLAKGINHHEPKDKDDMSAQINHGLLKLLSCSAPKLQKPDHNTEHDFFQVAATWFCCRCAGRRRDLVSQTSRSTLWTSCSWSFPIFTRDSRRPGNYLRLWTQTMMVLLTYKNCSKTLQSWASEKLISQFSRIFLMQLIWMVAMKSTLASSS